MDYYLPQYSPWLAGTLQRYYGEHGFPGVGKEENRIAEVIRTSQATYRFYRNRRKLAKDSIAERLIDLELIYCIVLQVHKDFYNSILNKATYDVKFSNKTAINNIGVLWGLALDHLIAIKDLAWCGRENQVRILLRALIEVYDTALCIAGDESFFNSYSKLTWQADGAPIDTPPKRKTVDRLAGKLIKQYEKDSESTFPVYRRNMYKELSNFTHASWVSTTNAMYGRPYNHPSDIRQLTTGGMHTHQLEGLVYNILFYSVGLVEYTQFAFLKNHGQYFEKLGEQGKLALTGLHLAQTTLRAFSADRTKDGK